ncbi:MAG TPA: response regulator [Desulfobacterales bacterium]|nr:response regulator [Desulfobacterales bacterium]
MVNDFTKDPEKLLTRIEYLEENRRFVQNMLEMAISLVDFQENIVSSFGPENILEEAEKRIRHLIPFEANALYLVDQDSSDLQFAVCNPLKAREFIAAELEDLIEKGFFAWAIRERRGITIASRNRSKRFVMHIIATQSRIRGMFIGQLDGTRQQIPDTSLTLLSIILLNTANALESLEFYRLLRHQQTLLEKKVEERTQALAESERQMQQVLKLQSIGTLAGGIAHDFNNLLFPIIGYTELAMDDIPPENPARKSLEEVLKAASRAKELIQQILTFSRRNGRERSPIRVPMIIRETLKLLRASIPTTIDISADLEENCSPIMANPTQMHQVVMNLCTNAYQAIRKTGGKIQIRLGEVNIGYEEMAQRIGIKMGPHLHLVVQDDGVGMDASVLERIFEPYFTTQEPGKGTGLGLSVIHGIVKNHGGFITVESRPGQGSSFHVYLPTIDEMAQDIEVEIHATETGGGERILLVDDEEQIVAMEKQLLEKLGYQVTACASSSEAWTVFSARPDQFDLMITDMTMPHMAGDRLSEKILDIRPNLPVILCTGYNDMIDADKALAMGIRKFVMKPLEKNELSRAIRSALELGPTGSSQPAPAIAVS